MHALGPSINPIPPPPAAARTWLVAAGSQHAGAGPPLQLRLVLQQPVQFAGVGAQLPAAAHVTEDTPAQIVQRLAGLRG